MRVIFMGTGDIAIPSFRWLLGAQGVEVVALVTQPDKPEGALSETEFAALLQTAQGWIIGPQAHVTRALIAASPSCLVFSRRGVGYERVDISAAKDLGRIAAIATGGNEESVADHAIGMMLAVAVSAVISIYLADAGYRALLAALEAEDTPWAR